MQETTYLIVQEAATRKALALIDKAGRCANVEEKFALIHRSVKLRQGAGRLRKTYQHQLQRELSQEGARRSAAKARGERGE